MTRSLLFAALVLVLTGCGAGVAMSTELQRYTAGEIVRALVVNGSTRAFHYPDCPFADLERLAPDPAVIPVPAYWACLADITMVEAGGSLARSRTLPEDLPPGTYQLSLPISWGTGAPTPPGEKVRSNSFEVVAAQGDPVNP